MMTACSFHNPQMWSTRRRSVPGRFPCRSGGDVELRQIGIWSDGRLGFPEQVELSLRVGDGQAWRENAVVVVTIDPHRPLWRIVAIASGRASHLTDTGGAGAAERARQQVDGDIGGLPVDRGTAGFTVARLPALDESAVLGQPDALEIG